MKIALTGGIACGKSLVAKFLRELGFVTLDADDVVHELEAPGGAAVHAIASRFGSSVLSFDGGIDRAKLAEMVFGGDRPRTSAARRDLEAILHPLVRHRLLSFVSRPPLSAVCRLPSHTTLNSSLLTLHFPLAVIPLLFESHWESDYDTILCVSSAEEVQIDRMMRMRDYTRAQAEARLAAQLPVAEKAARADWTIHNDSTVEALKAEVQRCALWLVGRMEQNT